MDSKEFKKMVDDYGRNNIGSTSILKLTDKGIVFSTNPKSVLGHYEHSLHELLFDFSRNFNEIYVQHAVDFINSTVKEIQERIFAAEVLGRLCFQKGNKCIAAQEPELMELLEGLQVGQGSPIIGGFIEGYDSAEEDEIVESGKANYITDRYKYKS